MRQREVVCCARRAAYVAALLVTLGVCVSDCSQGGAARTGATHPEAARADTALPQPEIYTDPDIDSDIYPGEADNENNQPFGDPPGAADVRAVTRLIEHYYAGIAAGDGAAVCRLLYAPLAESLPETYGGSGPRRSTGSGESCAEVAARLLATERARVGRRGRPRVAAVRVRNRTAAVQLGFGSGRPRYYLELTRERGAWTVSRLVASEQAVYVE